MIGGDNTKRDRLGGLGESNRLGGLGESNRLGGLGESNSACGNHDTDFDEVKGDVGADRWS
jgi:hypothetical protein